MTFTVNVSFSFTVSDTSKVHTGDSLRTIALGIRFTTTTLAGIISQMCEAIWSRLLFYCTDRKILHFSLAPSAPWTVELSFAMWTGSWLRLHITRDAMAWREKSAENFWQGCRWSWSIKTALVRANIHTRLKANTFQEHLHHQTLYTMFTLLHCSLLHPFFTICIFVYVHV